MKKILSILSVFILIAFNCSAQTITPVQPVTPGTPNQNQVNPLTDPGNPITNPGNPLSNPVNPSPLPPVNTFTVQQNNGIDNFGMPVSPAPISTLTSLPTNTILQQGTEITSPGTISPQPGTITNPATITPQQPK